MKLGAWIHPSEDEVAFDRQFAAAAAAGIESVRGYSVEYSERVAPSVRKAELSLVAGLHVDATALVEDWRSQVRLDELDRTIALDCRLEAICVGNELREGGDAWESKRFSARLSFGLARVLEEYRRHLDAGKCDVPLTYAMEGIVFGSDGRFREHLWPLVDVLDVVSVNLYPMTVAHWRDYSAFDVSAQFLRNDRVWHRQLSSYESHLREILEATGEKRVFLSEMGFPSGVGYTIDGEIDGKPHVQPTHDIRAFQGRMIEYVSLLRDVSADYDGRLECAYFYEWWDNHAHPKIWNIEQSPIHSCFGLCDYEGRPKFDVQAL